MNREKLKVCKKVIPLLQLLTLQAFTDGEFNFSESNLLELALTNLQVYVDKKLEKEGNAR